MAKFFALVRKSTGDILRRTSTLPAKSIPDIKGLDADLDWLEVVHSQYPVIDIETEGVSYKEEIRDGKFHVDFISFKISEGRTKPIEIKMERIK